MIDEDTTTEVLWDHVLGRVSRGAYGYGTKDGLVRALCWGNRSAWQPMVALVEIVQRLESRIAELEAVASEGTQP